MTTERRKAKLTAKAERGLRALEKKGLVESRVNEWGETEWRSKEAKE